MNAIVQSDGGSADVPRDDVYDDDSAFMLPQDVREFSDLIIDGSVDAQRALFETLNGMNGLEAARLIIVSLTHPDCLIGLDEIEPLWKALHLN